MKSLQDLRQAIEDAEMAETVHHYRDPQGKLVHPLSPMLVALRDAVLELIRREVDRDRDEVLNIKND